jgi:DnaJ-class molecular chaperone
VELQAVNSDGTHGPQHVTDEGIELVSDETKKKCPTCHGLGEWMHWVQGVWYECHACKGSGEVSP